MTPRRTPDCAAGRLIRLPVIDVTVVDVALRAVLASVLPLHATDQLGAAEPPPPQRTNPARPPATDGRAEDDAMLALMQSEVGYQAATAATGRVVLPSLGDFLA